MSPTELAYIAGLAQRRCSALGSIIVELGSWRGRSAVAWAENSNAMVYCVDTFDDGAFGDAHFPEDPPDLHDHPNWLLNEFQRNTRGLANVIAMRMTTAEAAQVFAAEGLKADVVFVDAGHLEHEVVADIEAWRPLLKEDGIMAGHDYGYEGWPAVKIVVDRTIPKFHVIETIWTTEEEQP
jgi:predicted O-methyltransferase YrrM